MAQPILDLQLGAFEDRRNMSWISYCQLSIRFDTQGNAGGETTCTSFQHMLIHGGQDFRFGSGHGELQDADGPASSPTL